MKATDHAREMVIQAARLLCCTFERVDLESPYHQHITASGLRMVIEMLQASLQVLDECESCQRKS